MFGSYDEYLILYGENVIALKLGDIAKMELMLTSDKKFANFELRPPTTERFKSIGKKLVKHFRISVKFQLFLSFFLENFDNLTIHFAKNLSKKNEAIIGWFFGQLSFPFTDNPENRSPKQHQPRTDDDDCAQPDEKKSRKSELPKSEKSAIEKLISHITTEEFLLLHDVLIDGEDCESLRKGNLITGAIVDFSIKDFFDRLPDATKKRCFVFQTAVFAFLRGWNDSEHVTKEQRYERVKNVMSVMDRLFESDFIFFPCNEGLHWYLVVACFFSYTSEMKSQPPIMLIFDSIVGNTSRHQKSAILIQDFLSCLYVDSFPDEVQLFKPDLKFFSPSCPRQSNNSDCALFLIEFFKRFTLKSPLDDFKTPIDLSKWFDPRTCLTKRQEIAQQIMEKSEMLPTPLQTGDASNIESDDKK